MPAKYSHSAKTDIGRRRQNNEDNLTVLPEALVFMVCSGRFLAGRAIPAVREIEHGLGWKVAVARAARPRGMDPVAWELIDMQDYHSAVIEIPAPGAVLKSVWSFEECRVVSQHREQF